MRSPSGLRGRTVTGQVYESMRKGHPSACARLDTAVSFWKERWRLRGHGGRWILGLTRISGYSDAFRVEGFHDAKDTTAIRTGVPEADHRPGAQRRSPEELVKEFEPSGPTIREWVAQADRDEGRRIDGVISDERKELARLKREQAPAERARDSVKGRGTAQPYRYAWPPTWKRKNEC